MHGQRKTTLSIRRIGIDTWRENVAYLHRDCPVVRAAGFQALSKVEIHANGPTILAVLATLELSFARMVEVVQATRACLAWGAAPRPG